PRDVALRTQSTHPPKNSGGRRMHLLRQFLVGEGTVTLQNIEYAQIEIVQRDGGKVWLGHGVNLIPSVMTDRKNISLHLCVDLLFQFNHNKEHIFPRSPATIYARSGRSAHTASH